jgi:hypothetical protein
MGSASGRSVVACLARTEEYLPVVAIARRAGVTIKDARAAVSDLCRPSPSRDPVAHPVRLEVLWRHGLPHYRLRSNDPARQQVAA